ncbi:hypothetical protein GOP47_0028703 [Adiantum capillus-veneris]|nr:hypothetical protein GOP47_0028703 [Adiantum capillus-veneris]
MATSAHLAMPLLLLALFFYCCSATVASLVPASPLHLAYHHGPLLAGPDPIKLSLTFYGHFEPSQRATLKAFLSSFSPSSVQANRRSLRGSVLPVVETPSVSSWWSLTHHFSDLQGHHVSQSVIVDHEIDDAYSLGRSLTASDIASLAKRTANHAKGENSVSVIFTSADVMVDGFCMHACGGHSYSNLEDGGNPDAANGAEMHSGYGARDGMDPYVWVGNPETQCPGLCAWPFAKPQYGPVMEPLKAPNGVGVDGMVIALAKLLVGTATNPMGNAFYQGEATSLKLEAGEICTGKYGAGAYPGFPGELLQNPRSGASYNMEGRHGVQFLVPWIWNLASGTCAGQA